MDPTRSTPTRWALGTYPQPSVAYQGRAVAYQGRAVGPDRRYSPVDRGRERLGRRPRLQRHCPMVTRVIFNQTFSLELIIAVIVFALVTVTLLIAVVSGRPRRGRRPSRRAQHTRTELAYATVVAGMAAYLVTNSILQNGKETGYTARPAASVLVTGFQWCWKFAYTGTPVAVTGQCQDGRGPTLTLPEGVPVRISVTSSDVVHEMWVPYLRFKLEAIPGYTHSFTSVLNHTGMFPGRCSEFCGLYHWAMVFQLHVVPEPAYRRWLSHQERLVSSGTALSAKAAGK